MLVVAEIQVSPNGKRAWVISSVRGRPGNATPSEAVCWADGRTELDAFIDPRSAEVQRREATIGLDQGG